MVISEAEEPGGDAPMPGFPDGPKLELDELLQQLIGRAQDVVATQGRLRGLLRANRSIVGNLPLPVLLRRIVQAGCELAHARYGALGVNSPSGGLEQFVHVGMDDARVLSIGHLPEGKGLLGALIDDPRPIRLQSMARDSRSAGFPAGHPPMSAFLGVPIRVREEVFGSLYLTDPRAGEFAAEDEELVSALAATAGVAIENARLYEESSRRQAWLQASTEVTQQLLSADGKEPLLLVARRAREMADASVVTVELPAHGGRVTVEIASGAGEELLAAMNAAVDGTPVDMVLGTGRPVLLPHVGAPGHPAAGTGPTPIGPVMILPLGGAQHMRGAMVVGRLPGQPRFTDADLEMATTFANHAAIALELSEARNDQQRLALLEDRDRIARDLHDHVIQRLFAAGLTVQSVAAALGDDDRAVRLTRVVGDIDETMRQARTSIFQLRGPLGPETGTARSRLLAVSAEVAPLLGFTPDVAFTGAVDALMSDAVLDDAVAVLREALTNTARHARAQHADVRVTLTADTFTMAISDDGVGLGDSPRRSGLANLRHRAERHGGSLTVLSNGPGAAAQQEGTVLLWTIPVR